jgi:hypothetical protein
MERLGGPVDRDKYRAPFFVCHRKVGLLETWALGPTFFPCDG